MLTRDLARTRNRLVKENSLILITIHRILKMKMMEHGQKMELRKKLKRKRNQKEKFLIVNQMIRIL